MNNNNGQLQLHPLLAQLLSGQGTQVSQDANQILDGTGAGKQLQDREAYLNNANSHAQGTLSNLLHNNPGGYVTDAAPLQGAQNSNVQTDNSMTLNALLGIINQATGMHNNAVQVAGSVNNNANDNATGMYNAQTNRINTQTNQVLNGIDPNTGNFVGADGGGGYSPQAVQGLKSQGATDLFPDGMSVPQQMQVMQDIQKSGGLANYRQTHTNNLGNDRQSIDGTVAALKQIDTVKNQIAKSKALRAYLGNGPLQGIAGYLNKFGGNFGDHTIGALSSDDVNALNILNKLNASSDYNTIHGRLDNYLAQRFGNTSLGQGKTAQDNLKILQQAEDDMSTGLDSYSKQHGYGSVDNLKSAIYGNPAAASKSKYSIIQVK